MSPKVKTFHHTKDRRNRMILATGNSNVKLAASIANYLSTEMADIVVTKFSDGESRIQINQNMRGMDVFIIQSLCNPVNDNIMDLLIMADAMKRASARRIVAVTPYYGYARQDKKMSSREPITAKLLADLIETSGVQRNMVMDLHADSIQGFFNIPVDHLRSQPTIVTHLKNRDICGEKTVIVSPDVGGVVRARAIANKLGCPLAIISKRRPRPNVTEAKELIGSVEGMKCVMIDDIVDTAGTLTKGAEMLMSRGASEVYAYCTHGVLSGPAFERIADSDLKELIITDTVPLPENKKVPKNIKVISVADVFGEAIIRNFKQLSISELFK